MRVATKRGTTVYIYIYINLSLGGKVLNDIDLQYGLHYFAVIFIFHTFYRKIKHIFNVVQMTVRTASDLLVLEGVCISLLELQACVR